MMIHSADMLQFWCMIFDILCSDKPGIGKLGGTETEDGRPMDVHEARTSMWCFFGSAPMFYPVFSGDVFMFAGLSSVFLIPTCQVRSLDSWILLWALPDFNRELQISVCTAGPQLRAPDLSVHCRTSTASSRSQWALPDLAPDFTGRENVRIDAS